MNTPPQNIDPTKIQAQLMLRLCQLIEKQTGILAQLLLEQQETRTLLEELLSEPEGIDDEAPEPFDPPEELPDDGTGLPVGNRVMRQYAQPGPG